MKRMTTAHLVTGMKVANIQIMIRVKIRETSLIVSTRNLLGSDAKVFYVRSDRGTNIWEENLQRL